MQAYGSVYARVYNLRWIDFARWIAPRILSFYAGTPIGQENRSVLDLCCGTGQLALYLLEHGYHVVGIDLSQPMIQHAIENAGAYVESGQARFIQADAVQFRLDECFGLVTSTFDALNHLESEGALRQCFESVFAVQEPGGYFIFDLNTRGGLKRWNSIRVVDEEEMMIITRGIYDGQSSRAYTHLSGFIQTEDGLYERFEETVYNTVFDMAWVEKALLEIGWRSVYFAHGEELATPIEEPEKEKRVFFVALK